MDLRASLAADCSPEVLFGWVGALDTYDRIARPRRAAQPDASDQADKKEDRHE